MSELDVKAPPGATSTQLRQLGLRGAALGVALLVPGGFFFLIAKDSTFDTFGTRVGDTVLSAPVRFEHEPSRSRVRR
jgi:hypothetical protein